MWSVEVAGKPRIIVTIDLSIPIYHLKVADDVCPFCISRANAQPPMDETALWSLPLTNSSLRFRPRQRAATISVNPGLPVQAIVIALVSHYGASVDSFRGCGRPVTILYGT
jgi:hypothetical protein